MLVDTLKDMLPDPVYAALRDVKRGVRGALPFDESHRARVALADFDGFRLAYRANTSDEEVIKHSFSHDIFFPAIPNYVPEPTDTIIDVGAHIGTFTLLAARKVPHGVVHAIEASAETCDLLRINLELNRAENAHAHHLALTDSTGPLRLHHDLAGNWGHSITKKLSRRGEVVPGETLPRFFEANHIDHVNLIKFNCEGAEFPILTSCPDEVLRRVDKMLVLYHAELVTGYTLEALLAKLQQAGFSTEVFDRTSRTRGWIRVSRL